MIWILMFYNKITNTTDDNALNAVQTHYFSSGLVICVIFLVILGVVERLFYKGKLTKDYMVADKSQLKKPKITNFKLA